MLGPAQYSEDYSYEQDNKGNGQPEEYLDYNLDDSQKNAEQLIESFHEQEMDENILYEMFINNDIAINLYQSLFKLKKGTDQKVLKSPCQIKLYPKLKIMVIYLIVSYNFLRIKTELLLLRENPKYKKPDEKELEKKINTQSLNAEESQLINLNNNKNSEEINKEKEIIFTLELFDLFNLLDILLRENKDNPISISINNSFSMIEGKVLCPETFNQTMSGSRMKCCLMKNEIFAYKISPPEEKSEIKINENNDEEEDEKNSDLVSLDINNIQSKSISQINHMNEENSEYLEKKFTTDDKCAKYIIEGSDLVELYHLMKGLEPLYYDLSTQTIGISMTNEKALFFILAYEKIQDCKSLSHLSRCIKHMTSLNIKSVKNHFLTPFKYGFNSFYRVKLMAKFITSFYNKDDRRLLVKVSPSGKMILSFTFSDPKNEMTMIEENSVGISTEINDNLNENENRNNNDSNNNRNRIKRNLIDRLLDDENRGNIVEMIFYASSFDLCKS